jgi:hypothetical protein
MAALSAATVIEVWERGLGQGPVDRALVLLSACAAPGENLPALTVGQRDARLTALHRRLFGETLEAYAECPHCGERLEYSMPARELEAVVAPEGEEALHMEWDGATLRLRLPDSVDLRAASGCRSVTEARDLLARRCIAAGGPEGELPDALVARIAERLAAAEPQAEQLVQLSCVACGHRWQLVLDIVPFLWARVAALAKRLMREVHVLARAYGWHEADILAMTAARRQFYLEIAGA